MEEIHFQTEKTIKHADFHGWNQGAIDVYGESDELIIVIENKVTVKEEIREDGFGQTWLYYDYIEHHKNDGQRCIYLFLTPDPTQQPSCDQYVQITYQEVFDSIISKCILNPELNAEGKYVLEQYASNLKEPYKKDDGRYPMALIHIPVCELIYDQYTECLDYLFSVCEQRKVDSIEYSMYKNYKEVFDEIYMSIEKYARTPDSAVERKFITFHELVNQGKLSENAEFIMTYDEVTYRARLVKNSQNGEWCMALLDEKGQVIEQHDSYRTPSRAAGDAVYLHRTKQGDFRERPSLNGRDYWTVCGQNIKLNLLMQ